MSKGLHMFYLASKLHLKYIKQQLTFPFNFYRLRNQKLDLSRTITFLSFKPIVPEKTSKIVYIGSEEDQYAWDLSTDFPLGGNSQAELSSEEGNRKFHSVRLQGHLQFFKELDYEGSLFAEISSTMLITKLFKEANGIKVTVKTDGNNYVLGLVVRENLGLQLYKVRNKKALITDNTQEWVELELPLKNMISENLRSADPINLEALNSGGVRVAKVKFGIYSYERIEGKFDVRIKNIEVISIQMIFKEEFEGLEQRYPHPIMFKKINQDSVDVGAGKIKFTHKEEIEY